MNTLQEAQAIIRRIQNKSEFAYKMSVIRQPSPKQRECIIRMAKEQLDRERGISIPVKGVTIAANINVSSITEMFDSAKKVLKFPKIRLKADDGKEMVISLAPDTGNNPGAIYIKVAEEYAGKITKEGNWIPKSGFESYTDFLVRFALHPRTEAIKYGKMTGNCCFCCKTLTDNRSVTAGYGPVCADNFGLSWGDI